MSSAIMTVGRHRGGRHPRRLGSLPRPDPLLTAWGQNPASDVGRRKMALTWGDLATGHQQDRLASGRSYLEGAPYTGHPATGYEAPFTGHRCADTPVGGPPSGAPFIGTSAI